MTKCSSSWLLYLMIAVSHGSGSVKDPHQHTVFLTSADTAACETGELTWTVRCIEEFIGSKKKCLIRLLLIL